MIATNKTSEAITVEGLRSLLFSVGDQSAKVHTISEEKYGQIISTKSVTGIRFELDDDGNQHIVIVTK